MSRAIRLARRGLKTAPNPRVGCVIVSGDRVMGEGWHERYGGAHAEVMALKQAGSSARGCTAYVTMEPCCAHAGKKTPPCSKALIRAGVAKVVAGSLDPNPDVAGEGLRQLRAAGLKTTSGALRKQAQALNPDFFSRMKTARPVVILKTALSLDGRAYAPTGRSRWITGKPARRRAHALRASCDAVLVGVETVLADDPTLTSHGRGRDPLRVVLDTRLRTPRRARIFSKHSPTVIFTASRARHPRGETIRIAKNGRGLDLKLALRILAQRGVRRLLLEGGPKVHASFLAAGMVDEVQVFIAPKLISGAMDPEAAPRLKSPRLTRIGSDFLFSGRLRKD